MNDFQKRVLIYSILVIFLIGAFLKSPYYKPEKISDFYVKMGIWENDKLEFYDLARCHYYIALLFNPKSAWAYNALGNTYYNQTGGYYISDELTRQGYEKAISDFTKAISLARNYPAAYTNRGDCYRFLGEYDKALEDYELALKYDSKNKRGLYGLSIIYGSKGYKQYNKAIKVLQKLVEFYPEYQDAYFGLGWNYDNIGNYKYSIENYEKVVELNPDRIDAWINLSYTAEMGLRDYEKAIYYADKALELNENSLYANSNKGYALVQLKRYDEAMKYIEKQLFINKEHSRAYFQRGQVKLAKNDKQGAKEDFERALELEKQASFDDTEKIIGMIETFLKQCK